MIIASCIYIYIACVQILYIYVYRGTGLLHSCAGKVNGIPGQILARDVAGRTENPAASL